MHVLLAVILSILDYLKFSGKYIGNRIFSSKSVILSQNFIQLMRKWLVGCVEA